MKTYIFILYFLLLFSGLFSQNRKDSYWLIGYDNGSSNPFWGGTDIVFDSLGNLNSYKKDRTINILRDLSLIANTRGDLLFYCNGYVIGNSNHDTVPQSNLYQLEDYPVNNNGSPIPQSSIILEVPSDSNIFYLFHHSVKYVTNTPYPNGYGWGIYCTTLDKRLNTNMGGIVTNSIPIIEDVLSLGGMTAVHHANGQDWWLVMPTEYADEYYTVYIHKNGIEIPILQKVPNIPHEIAQSGQCLFSKSGQLLVRNAVHGNNTSFNFTIANFDRCTGLFSNGRFFTSNVFIRGIALSPNEQILYSAENGDSLFQYHLDVNNTLTNRHLIAIDNNIGGMFGGFLYGYLAPNDKIYFVDNTNSLTVIEYPNKGGDSCMVMQHSVILPTINGNTVPNYPNFYLGPLVGSGCDTITTAINPPASFGYVQGAVYPNPANEAVNIEIQSNNCNRVGFMLLDLQGREVLHQTLPEKKTTIAVGNLAEGVYFYKIETDNQSYYGKLWIVR